MKELLRTAMCKVMNRLASSVDAGQRDDALGARILFDGGCKHHWTNNCEPYLELRANMSGMWSQGRSINLMW